MEGRKDSVRERGVSAEEVLERIKELAPDKIIEANVDLGDAIVRIRKDYTNDFFSLLKSEATLQFNMLSWITAVDWMDKRPERFEVVYGLYSFPNRIRLRVKVDVAERNPEVESVTHLWSSANFLEREVWDMYGIKFRNHPNLKRILLYEEFLGYPLRKDYPLQGKQPRVQLRASEVRNTARDMNRPPLVSINRRTTAEGE